MTKNIDRVGRVVQPFRNYKIEFEPPRITGKPPMVAVATLTPTFVGTEEGRMRRKRCIGEGVRFKPHDW